MFNQSHHRDNPEKKKPPSASASAPGVIAYIAYVYLASVIKM